MQEITGVGRAKQQSVPQSLSLHVVCLGACSSPGICFICSKFSSSQMVAPSHSMGLRARAMGAELRHKVPICKRKDNTYCRRLTPFMHVGMSQTCLHLACCTLYS